MTTRGGYVPSQGPVNDVAPGARPQLACAACGKPTDPLARMHEFCVTCYSKAVDVVVGELALTRLRSQVRGGALPPTPTPRPKLAAPRRINYDPHGPWVVVVVLGLGAVLAAIITFATKG